MHRLGSGLNLLADTLAGQSLANGSEPASAFKNLPVGLRPRTGSVGLASYVRSLGHYRQSGCSPDDEKVDIPVLNGATGWPVNCLHSAMSRSITQTAYRLPDAQYFSQI